MCVTARQLLMTLRIPRVESYRGLAHFDGCNSILGFRIDPLVAVEPVNQDVVHQDEDVEQGEAEL